MLWRVGHSNWKSDSDETRWMMLMQGSVVMVAFEMEIGNFGLSLGVSRWWMSLVASLVV